MSHTHLLLVRQFFEEVRRPTQAETPFLRMRRLLHLDYCVEMTLNTLVLHHGTPEQQARLGARQDPNRGRLWDLAEEVVATKLPGKTLPERAHLKTLAESRNLTQHRGSIPSSEEVRRFIEPVRTLLLFVCSQFYKAEFEKLRSWDELEHDQLRSWFHDCDEALEQGWTYLAAVGCKAMFEHITLAVRTGTTGEIPQIRTSHRTIRVDDRALLRPLEEFAELLKDAQKQIINMILALETEVVVVGLGLSFADYTRFLRTTWRVPVTLRPDGDFGAARPTALQHQEPSAEDVAFALEFLARAAVQLQHAVPGVLGFVNLPGRFKDSGLWNAPQMRTAPGDQAAP